MKVKNYCFAAAMLMGAALSAFGQATVVANPNSFTFDLGMTGAQEKKLVLTLNTGQSTVLTVTPSYVLINGSSTSQSIVTGTEITVRPATNATSGVAGSISVSGQGVTTMAIPVTFTGTGTGGSASFQVDKSSLNFYQAVGGQPPTAQVIYITSNLGYIPSYSTTLTYASGSLSGWAQVYQYANQVQVYINGTQSLTQGTYTAYLTLTPIVGTPVQIPINLYVGTGTSPGTGSFQVSPNPISFAYLPGTTPLPQTVTVTTTPNAIFTVTPSANLQGVLSVSPNPAQANAFGSATLTVTVLNNFLTTGVTGSLIFSGTGQTSTEIPVQINSGGSSAAGLTFTPSALTFNVPAGATTAPPSQTVQVISSDYQTKFLLISVQTPPGAQQFVTVQRSSDATPTTLTVSIDPSRLPSLISGNTYTSSITLGTTQGLGGFANIPVTVNVGGGGSGGGSGSGINVEPASVTLTARAGDTFGPQALVQLSVPGGGDPGYSSSVTTESGGNWLSVQPSSGSMGNRVTIATNVQNLAAGTYKGEVTFTSTGNIFVKLPVTLTVTGSGTITVTPKTLTFSHNLTSSSAPAAQTVQITGSGSTAFNWNTTVRTTSGSGWLQVSPTSGTTPGSLSVSVTPTALQPGTYRGTVDVTSAGATNSPQTIDVTLVVSSAPTPQIRTAVNGASFIAGPVSGGTILTLTGTDLGPSTGVAVQAGSNSVPTTLGGVQVRFDGIAAPLLYVSSSQINLVVPYEVAGRVTTRVEVEYQGVKSSTLELAVAQSSPGVFTQTATGSGSGAILNQNGTINRPDNPEVGGNVIVIYATGFGQLTPPPATGAIVPSSGNLPRPVLPVRVKIGGVESDVLYAGAAPGFVAGAIQLNVRIPLGTTGNAPVQIQVGEQSTAAFVTVSVR